MTTSRRLPLSLYLCIPVPLWRLPLYLSVYLCTLSGCILYRSELAYPMTLRGWNRAVVVAAGVPSTLSTPSTRSTLLQLSVGATPDLSLGLVALQQASDSVSDAAGASDPRELLTRHGSSGGDGQGAIQRRRAAAAAALRGGARRLWGIAMPGGRCQHTLGIIGVPPPAQQPSSQPSSHEGQTARPPN